jgi:hypothetical protein
MQALIQDEPTGASRRFEVLCGVTIAVFAAILAITDIAARHYSDDELIAHNEKATAYQWYQAKAVRETVVETQGSTIELLVAAGVVPPEKLAAIQDLSNRTQVEAARYAREKSEILLGSKVVGEDNWAQDFNGELGAIVGATEWEIKARRLGAAGGKFDLATLLLQLSVVLGPITLVSSTDILRKWFLRATVTVGLLGAIGSALAFHTALAT